MLVPAPGVDGDAGRRFLAHVGFCTSRALHALARNAAPAAGATGARLGPDRIVRRSGRHRRRASPAPGLVMARSCVNPARLRSSRGLGFDIARDPGELQHQLLVLGFPAGLRPSIPSSASALRPRFRARAGVLMQCCQFRIIRRRRQFGIEIHHAREASVGPVALGFAARRRRRCRRRPPARSSTAPADRSVA